MNYCSYFIEDKALFGSYPTQDIVNELENNNVKYFVNLTYNDEKKIILYKTKYNYIHYPIKDRKHPDDYINFSIFIIKLCNIISRLKNQEKLFLHCKGGHSRSGLVVSCILCYMYNITPSESLQKTSIYHKQRPILKDKWKKINTTLTVNQIKFLYKFFEPLYFYKKYKTGLNLGFSNLSPHDVKIYDNEKYTVYNNAEEAINFLKKNENNDVNIIYYKILTLKIDQHPNIKNNLLNTGLRPIIEKYTDNTLGLCLCKIRYEFFSNIHI